VTALVAVAVLVAGIAVALAPEGGRAARAEDREALRARLLRAPVRQGNVEVFRGPGTWIDIYDPSWSHPGTAVRRIAERGYRTLYLETSNYRSSGAFVHRTATERFLDAAERSGIAVVAWYLPGFRDLAKDERRSRAAIDLVTDLGNRFDAFALDIEASVVRDPDVRSARMLRLSERLRTYAETSTPEGTTYPLGAIIPSPRNLSLPTSGWPRFPYRELMSIYDVLVPMAYFSFHATGAAEVHAYMQRCFKVIRAESGVRTFPVHMIGGIADDTTRGEARAFARSIREHGGLGGSYYTFPLTKGVHHGHLGRLPVNEPQDPALPAALRYDAALGNVPGRDRSHPAEVVYVTDGKRGRWRLRYEVYDAQEGEIRVLVNWRLAGRVPVGPDDAWSDPRSVVIRDALLRRRGWNTITFVAEGTYPSWSVWGVRRPSLTKG
jgi:hypothetical protein